MSNEKLDKIIEEMTEEYLLIKSETPFYQNTSNCQLRGGIEELQSMSSANVDDGSVGCYIVGRIKVLEKLKNKYIYGDEYERNK